MTDSKYLHLKSMDTELDKAVIYDEWSETYDSYVKNLEYMAPKELVKLAIPYLRNNIGDNINNTIGDNKLNKNILDFGCGTGLVGLELKRQVDNNTNTHPTIKTTTNIVGIDISKGMIAKCRDRKNIYSKLFCCDLTQTNNKSNKLINEIGGTKFDMLLCSGVFLEGHLTLDIINRIFIHLVIPNGYICFTIRDSLLDRQKEELKRLSNSSKIIFISKNTISYLKGVNASAIVLQLT